MPLEVCETFYSILGESSYAGLPAFFIRLAGCNLRCSYCDTAYAYEAGRVLPEEALLAAAQVHQPHYVLVTGGEPLLQAGTLKLLTLLADAGYTVLLETNGSLPIHQVDPLVHRILDVKCPGSGMADRIYWANLDLLNDNDEVKFVISDHADFDWSLEIIKQHRLTERLPVLISPVFEKFTPQEAARNILKSGLPLRLNVQLHKYIWGSQTRGV